ncbi:MAG: energy transducer TonB [Nitrospira sp.]|nr:MAG: energy transducer TonB [Nitrospira sp.]
MGWSSTTTRESIAPMNRDAAMIDSGAMMRGWGWSVALHAVVWGLGLWLMSQGMLVSMPTFQWEVSMVGPSPQSRDEASIPPVPSVMSEKRSPTKSDGRKEAVLSARSVVARAVPKGNERDEQSDVTPYDMPSPSQSPGEPKDTMHDEAQEQAFSQSLSPSPADAPSESSAPQSTSATSSSTVVTQDSVRDRHHDDFGWLMQMLWSRVTELKRYPAEARLNRWEGRVIVRAVIDEHGHLLEVSIATGSGHDVLDEDAIAVIRRACPLALSQPLGQSRVVLRVPIQYRLDS